MNTNIYLKIETKFNTCTTVDKKKVSHFSTRVDPKVVSHFSATVDPKVVSHYAPRFTLPPYCIK